MSFSRQTSLRSALAIATTLLFSGAVLAQALLPQPPADLNPRKQGGFLANAGANCRGAGAADVQAFVTIQDGMQNTSGAPRTLVCNQSADEFALLSGNGTTLAAGLVSFTMVVRNNDATAQMVTCAGYAGLAGATQFSMNKSVLVQPGARASMVWDAVLDNLGVPFQRPTNIVCTIPNNVQANENSNRFFREVGDFVPQ